MLSFTDSFLTVWILWGTSIVALCTIVVVGCHRIDWQRLVKVTRDEEGAGYTLTFVMVMPLYILLICTVIETSLMLVAKIGTVYSAFAGARTAIVWNTATSASDAEERARKAAQRAMVPFASGMSGSDQTDSTREASGYIEAYRTRLDGKQMPVSEQYLSAKHACAHRAVDLEITMEPGPVAEPWNEDIAVTVTYHYPFVFPSVGKLFGHSDSNGTVGWTIASRVVLPNEAPQNKEKRLGISYASPRK